MKEWRYLVFLVKYHLNRWIREKKQGGVFYIGGSDVFPPPLKPEEELVLLEQLGGEEDVTVKSVLIERNLRLVVYIARKFENTGINVEDLISIGTIGLIKAINTFKVDKKIKLATYASRCIENEILMYLRRNSKTKTEVSIDEPLNVDWEGNELLLSDILGTENDIITKDIENKVDRELLQDAMQKLSGRERRIVEMRFGILPETEEKTQKEVADILGISQSYISRLEKKIMRRLKKEISKMMQEKGAPDWDAPKADVKGYPFFAIHPDNEAVHNRHFLPCQTHGQYTADCHFFRRGAGCVCFRAGRLLWECRHGFLSDA